MSATIGHDLETGELVTIGDTERRSGLYILGRSGMGKTNLFLNLMEQDCKNGHGVFFLDPHGKAISDLIDTSNFPSDVLEKILIIDPTDETHAFGINLLACKDVNKITQREDTYKRVYSVFEKVFKDDLGKWGVWLEYILQHTLRVFIENQQFTLADVPLFLDPHNSEFRDHVLQGITHNQDALYFWRHDFASRRKIDQESLIDAARTRVGILRADPYVRHIISQPETTIDFAQIMEKKQILLIRLSANLASDTKKFIGTLLISEFVHAARRRQESKRHQFCIFVDEFQNFSSEQYFSILFTEARKFGIATTVAHQDRYGQFADNKAILGATDAAMNKIFFQPSSEDAQRAAPEFAKEPPKELKLERQLVISQDPVSVLLRGHKNPQIQNFVNRHLLRLQEQLEDTRAELEGGRLIRTEMLDQVAIKRLEAQATGLGRDPHVTALALEKTKRELYRIQDQTENLFRLFETAESLRLTLRAFNKFLIAVMEGSIRPGTEEFSEFLCSRVQNSTLVPQDISEILELYVSLLYGDPNKHRVIPFAFAQAQELFLSEVTPIANQADKKTKEARAKFREEYVRKDLDWFIEKNGKTIKVDVSVLEHRQSVNKAFGVGVFGDYEWRLHRSRMEDIWSTQNLYILYGWIRSYPEIFKLLAPFANAHFTPSCDWLVINTDSLTNNIKYHSKEPPGGHRLSHWWIDTGRFMTGSVVRDLISFLRRYEESALVMFSLLITSGISQYAPKYDDNDYFRLSMMDFPGIAGIEPFEVFRTAKKLNDFMVPRGNNTVFLNLFERKEVFTLSQRIFSSEKRNTEFHEKLYKVGYDFRCVDYNVNTREARKIRFLATILNDRWEWFRTHFGAAAEQWTKADEATRWYFLSRASEFVYFGESAARDAYPQPTFPGAKELTDGLIGLLKDTEKSLFLTEMFVRLTNWNDALNQRRREIEKRCVGELVAIVHHPPTHLASRALSSRDIDDLLSACLREFSRCGWDPQMTLAVLDEFVQFCSLLAMPENHVETLSGQYIKTEANARVYRDMNDEMAQVLLNLPLYTAYAKVIKHRGGDRIVRKRKIKTEPRASAPKALYQGGLSPLERTIINRSRSLYCRERTEIEKELWQRQEAWRKTAVRPLPTRTRGKRKDHALPNPGKPPPSRT